jgi:glycine/D-amino acid oxidase-like deaminating enzyme
MLINRSFLKGIMGLAKKTSHEKRGTSHDSLLHEHISHSVLKFHSHTAKNHHRHVHFSPWITQLRKSRRVRKIIANTHADVCIVGAGISGITTAYYLLKDTDMRVVVIDAQKMAHGATGHNAGQIASYFEHSFSLIAKEHGLEMAAQGQRDVLGAWDLLDHIIHEAEIATKPESFAGFAGCSTIAQLLSHLENSYLRAKEDVSMSFAYVADDPKVLAQIPKKYAGLYSVVTSENIRKKLETDSKDYFAALTVRKGCMNSAKFCEEVVDFLVKTYGTRFSLFELSPVFAIDVKKQEVVVHSHKSITAKQVILCTNGYKSISFLQPDLEERFFAMGHGLVGHMAGLEKPTYRDSTAITYFPKNFKGENDAYYYITRRRITKQRALLCIGGPDLKLEGVYNPHKQYLPDGEKQSATFLETVHKYSSKHVKFKYSWEGLMGFTISGVRCVGPDPVYNRVMYNLGCNGVGILTTIFASKRISLLLTKKKVKPSIFDSEYLFAKLAKLQKSAK